VTDEELRQRLALVLCEWRSGTAWNRANDHARSEAIITADKILPVVKQYAAAEAQAARRRAKAKKLAEIADQWAKLRPHAFGDWLKDALDAAEAAP
jgi:hypothetical protein